MADDYVITTRSEGLLGQIGRWGAALITDEEMLEAIAAHDAEKRAEWEAESFECPNCLINESDATSREDWMFDQSSRWGLAAAESRARSADRKETP